MKRRLALAVLVAAAALAVLAFPFRATWWGGWILAIAEAGIVGGLADWFAVTALFRRPLGLPIPHTALIPANWELMARRVGTMVGDRVLTREYVGSEIARLDVAGLLARAAERLHRRDLEAVTAAIVRWAAAELPPGAGGDRPVGGGRAAAGRRRRAARAHHGTPPRVAAGTASRLRPRGRARARLGPASGRGARAGGGRGARAPGAPHGGRGSRRRRASPLPRAVERLPALLLRSR